MSALAIQAGPLALARLRDNGFRAEDVRMMAGASGGAKWLVLSGLDRAILGEIAPRFTAPVHLVGSSIGSWRFGCYAQPDPLGAIERFENIYIDQTYSDKPTREEISRVGAGMLDSLIGPEGAKSISEHPVFRLHVMAVRARHLLASERTSMLLTGLTAAMLANTVSRKALGSFFTRALVSDTRDPSPFDQLTGFPIEHIALTTENIQPAIQASGAIPMVLNGVRDIPGAQPGVYRDGGIIDYHLDLPLSVGDGLTLYPHFYEHITPGWFDKRLRWRRPAAANLQRVILVSPSAAFVDRLPYRKIPDRKDFKTLDAASRRRAWRTVVDESRRLGDAFLEWAESPDPAAGCRPLVL